MSNGYLAFYNGQEHEVWADTAWDAQVQAVKHYQTVYPRRKIKDYQVNVVLCVLNGEQYTHSGEIPV